MQRTRQGAPLMRTLSSYVAVVFGGGYCRLGARRGDRRQEVPDPPPVTATPALRRAQRQALTLDTTSVASRSRTSRISGTVATEKSRTKCCTPALTYAFRSSMRCCGDPLSSGRAVPGVSSNLTGALNEIVIAAGTRIAASALCPGRGP